MSRISSEVLSMSRAAISTRGVKTSCTVVSPKSRADWTSSLLSGSKPPSSSMVSMMSWSSSSVTVGISSAPKSFDARSLTPLKKKESGVSSFIRKDMEPAKPSASCSLWSPA